MYWVLPREELYILPFYANLGLSAILVVFNAATEELLNASAFGSSKTRHLGVGS